MKRAAHWVTLLGSLLILLSTSGKTTAHDQPLQMTGEGHELGEEWVLDSIVVPHCRDDHDEFPAICVCWHHGYFVDNDGARTDQPGCLDYIGDRAGDSVSSGGEKSLTLEDRILIQKGLASLGFNVGAADGIFGPRTRGMIYEWQQSRGFEATGYLTAG